MSEKEFQVQTDLWYGSVRQIASTIPSLDFIGWHGEHFVVVRNDGEGAVGCNGSGVGVQQPQPYVDIKDLPTRRRLDCGTGVDLGGDDAAWLERKDVPIDYEQPGLAHFES